MQNLQPFIDTHIKKIEVNDFNALNPNDFDAFIVGSDQVWRRLYMPDIYREYLSFAEGWNVRRISYAASFGTEEWEYSPLETTECRRLLQKFDAVSVREASGVSLCKKHFGVEAVHVVDPTLLLDRDEPHQNGLLVYLLDQREENEKMISYFANTLGLMPANVTVRFRIANLHSGCLRS